MSEFRDAFLRARRRIDDGEDPEVVVPDVIAAADSPEEIDVLLDTCDNIEGKCLCPLGDACAMPVRSVVKGWREEFERHIAEGGCPFVKA